MLLKPASCFGCPLHHISSGFSRPVGTGEKGVLVVAEALGEQEAQAGQALVGKAGHYLFNALKRVGIEREDLALYNVLSCRPPDNKLAGMPYEHAAISHCSPNLDGAIRHYRGVAAAHERTFVIVALGKIAFKRLLRLDDKRHERLLKNDYLCYPFWSEEYGAWVIAADHPAYLMRGNHHLVSILQFAFQRAMEIAAGGFSYQEDHYLLDPPAEQFDVWVTTYLGALARDPENVFLSYDIETPYKSGADEEEVAKEVDDDRTILRCAFSYRPGHSVTVPWRSDYLPALRRVFREGRNFVGWNSNNYDDPRVHAQTPMSGISIDAMLAWHVLNSALPKGLGFVTPFYAQRMSMWKHLAEAEPAFYNAKDADAALQNWLGIRRDLGQGALASVFNRHVIEVNRLFGYMRDTGVTLDLAARQAAETQLQTVLDGIEGQIESVIPFEARTLKVYKKTPAVTDGLVQTPGLRTTKRCSVCGSLDVRADHFKSIGVKKLKAGDAENPCVEGTASKLDVPATLWALPEPFKLSNVALQRYQKVVRHLPIIDPKKKSITFDDKAMLRLKKQHPRDPLYPLVGEFRKHQGLLSKYVGRTQENGFVKGGLQNENGIIAPQFTHNPSTLRSACQNPPLQQLPRTSNDPDDLNNLIRNLIVARPGHTFLARDYSGIEAVLVGYFAHDRGYIRLAKQDVHSFYTAYALHALDGRIGANDLPLLSWDDDKLFTRLADIKKEFKKDRNALYKHLVHGANFMQGPRGAAEKILAETGTEFPVALVKRVMDIYFELFPAIRTWHRTILAQADRDGHVTNPFGYVHRFHRAYEWEKIGDQWQKTPGPDANKIIAFLPQSTAAGIIKEAMLRMFDNFDSAGQYLRLLVHDEIFCEVPTHLVQQVDGIMRAEMETPIKQMPLPPEWGMGSHLVVLTEAKQGERWGLME